MKRVFKDAFEPDEGKINFVNAPNVKDVPCELQSAFSFETFQKGHNNRNKARRLNEESSRVFVQKVNPKASELIKLNVGGTNIITRLETLLKKPESHLHAMFSEMDLHKENEVKEHESTTDTFDLQFNKLDDGSIFIDRNPKAFQLMIDYLKSAGDGADFLYASSRS